MTVDWKLRRYGAARKRAKQRAARAAERRRRVVQLLLEGHTLVAISKQLKEEGFAAGYTTIKKDVAHIRQQVHQGKPCPACGRKLPPGVAAEH